MLDLTQLPGQTLQVDIMVNREAAFDNFVGFYEIDNEEGAIGNLNPGDAGYTEAAIASRVKLDSNNSGSLRDHQFTGKPSICTQRLSPLNQGYVLRCIIQNEVQNVG